MEAVLADQPQAFEDTEYYRLYQYMFGALTDRKIIAKSSPKLAVTEPPADDGTCTVIALNYGKPETYTLTVKAGWILDRVEYGNVTQTDSGSILIAPAPKSICRFTLKRS